MDPLTIVLIIAAAGGVYLYSKPSSTTLSSSSQDVFMGSTSSFVNSLGLIDIDPNSQEGVWKIDFDNSFQKASVKNGVPFALLKAHAIRESQLDGSAYREEPPHGSRPPSASYGLMQILWWKNSNRFNQFGYSDDTIGDGSLLYGADVNCDIGAQIILQNWKRFQNLRDTINSYNTGVAESVRVAPNNYVNDVLKYYSTLVGRQVS